VSVRVAIVAESFPPDVNGVAHCVLRVTEHLVLRGHQPLVVAPAPARNEPGEASSFPCPVVRLPSVPMPGYPGFRIGLPTRRLHAALTGHGAELMHLASPFVLGSSAVASARRERLPTVAVYQTDVPAYARVYGAGRPGEAAAWRWLRRIHNAAERTLAPSAASAASLREHGVQRVWLWGRGVDTERFDPARCSPLLRQGRAPGGEVLVGYVGRLAPEKRVDLLWQVAALPGVRLVVVGGGPAAAALRRALPGAVFLGPRHGTDLATIYASLDVFVHSGACETFGQTLQEAAASGLPVVAPAAGGPLDLVDHGRTGYLVAPGDAAALAGAVALLAGDPQLRAAMGRAGRAKAIGRSWCALGDQLIDHYSSVLGKSWRTLPLEFGAGAGVPERRPSPLGTAGPSRAPGLRTEHQAGISR
jgi:phosphatidylinositol alpha 1,6-mannosyltransferase